MAADLATVLTPTELSLLNEVDHAAKCEVYTLGAASTVCSYIQGGSNIQEGEEPVILFFALAASFGSPSYQSSLALTLHLLVTTSPLICAVPPFELQCLGCAPDWLQWHRRS